MTIDYKALAAPTPKAEAKTRKGPGGTTLTYVDARFVMDRLDEVVGPAGWSDSYIMNPDGSVACTITIDGVSKTDVGVPSKIEPAKGSYSDAFKRAAVKWGIGRDLYDEDSEVRQSGNSGSGRAAANPSADAAEAAVVGQRGLTQSQRGKLFASLADAGITGDQRKAFVWLAIRKHSVKDMNADDLQTVLDVLDAPREQNPQVWENVELVSPE